MTATSQKQPMSLAATPRRGRSGSRRGRAIVAQRPGFLAYAFLAAILLGALFPIYWTILIGSGDSSTINDPTMSWIPGGNFVKNALSVINNESVAFWKSLGNSLIVSTVVSASVVFFSTLAGYAFAKLRFRGKRGLLAFVIATMAVPTQLGVVPLFIAMSNFGWTGTLGAVIVPALVTAFGVFWMTQYIGQALPDELIEAGRIDGANMFKTFWYIGLPSARPAAAMLALFTFIMTWTNFFWPFIVLGSANPTLPVALATLQANYFVDYSVVLAGVLLATLPLIALFVVAGRHLVAGIMQGAVKG
ncbi:carbohydrate ABC transporter permease [Galbitalea soli]|uniref:Carbohydrate ABC transporter permease n=1 Tax=Galbitalea soli TaxID=1268042 RepID=A0A7C9PPV7_9MICO|nr:carbohydrate ABC transporter permease [Galbitalea soli]NEM92530.1 carbohydrate ABC transporter permease [Galbitalea soli]NYJ29567.1 cellobiose transport system permease protein [Galbitalea soli]